MPKKTYSKTGKKSGKLNAAMQSEIPLHGIDHDLEAELNGDDIDSEEEADRLFGSEDEFAPAHGIAFGSPEEFFAALFGGVKKMPSRLLFQAHSADGAALLAVPPIKAEDIYKELSVLYKRKVLREVSEDLMWLAKPVKNIKSKKVREKQLTSMKKMVGTFLHELKNGNLGEEMSGASFFGQYVLINEFCMWLMINIAAKQDIANYKRFKSFRLMALIMYIHQATIDQLQEHAENAGVGVEFPMLSRMNRDDMSIGIIPGSQPAPEEGPAAGAKPN